MHPDDSAYLDNTTFDHSVLPCPFDGPLEKAKVVICLANPNYAKSSNTERLSQLVLAHRSGEEALPQEFDQFYQRVTRPIGVPLADLRTLVAIFNVCPYASLRMEDPAIRHAAGLPSVWQAQKFLREVLIPRAQTGNIFLLVIRKLQLWGVTKQAEEHGNFRVVPDRGIHGVMPATVGEEIRTWLERRRLLSKREDQPERVRIA